MGRHTSRSRVVRFGLFEADLLFCELRKRGILIKLQEQPFRILALLLNEPGALVSREEIRRVLWADDTFVDFEKSLNAAVAKLRQALGDTAENPRFIETVPRRGYRFLAPVSSANAEADAAPVTSSDPAPGLAHTAPALTAANGSSPAIFNGRYTGPERRKSLSQNGLVRQHKWKVIVLLSAAIIVISALSSFLLRDDHQAAEKTGVVEFTRVTGSGDIQRADISPDGKYVAIVRGTGGKQTLWLKQLATDRDLQIAALGEDQCPGVAFSPDGTYVYFVRQEPLRANGDLYQVSSLGGTPKKILSDINGPPAISPDGQRVAFVRSTLFTHGEDKVMTAWLDGSGERVLASYQPPGIHLSRITWSPDGKKLVYVALSIPTSIRVDGGQPQALSDGQQWNEIQDLAPLPQSSDILVAGYRRGQSAPFQLYGVSLESGEVRQITHDLSWYTGVRATADGKTLLVLQQQTLSRVQVAKPEKGSSPDVLSVKDKNHDGQSGLAWTGDGRIIYCAASNADDREDLWMMDGDGSNPQRLTHNRAGVAASHPAVSPHGNFIAFSLWSENDQANIWRIDMDGANLRQLTHGNQDFPPAISPDGKWIVFATMHGDRNILMKIPSEGGPASQLTDYASDHPSISPDGKWIACFYTPGQDQPTRLAIVPFSGGPPTKVLPLPVTANLTARLVWTPDGRSVSFLNNANGVSNVWEQPIAGGLPRPVTHFTSDTIFYFDRSHDGRLALSRGTDATDAVLLKGF